jgi:radical SAM superfamily enzyme YgiQ (UPF0313 family)
MTNSKIILNWLPPSSENSPSPAESTLKAHLIKNGYECEIVYWNLELRNLFLDFLGIGEFLYANETLRLYPIYFYMAIKYNDDQKFHDLIYKMQGYKPILNSKGISFIKKQVLEFVKELDIVIDNRLDELNLNNCSIFGLSSQFYQWFLGNIICEKIKSRNLDIKILIGGFGTKEEAYSFMDNYSIYDYAIWGEGEHALLLLAQSVIEKKSNEKDFHNIVYRKGKNLLITNAVNKYIDLNDAMYDFEDYFKTIKMIKFNGRILMPLEGGRGCHWQKCHFCFLNTGYKFRNKKPSKIISDIIYYASTYEINDFFFLDNDIIANDFARFNELSDLLIEYRSKNNLFKIELAEIISKNIDFQTIKKMSQAGFKAVQIGYESPSNNLLNKINKKNTFASNLFFIKWGIRYGISALGLNVLRNLIEETKDDIKEGIDNLYYMRFFFHYKPLFHNDSFLGISSTSKYFNKIKEKGELEKYKSTHLDALPRNYIKKEHEYILLVDHIDLQYEKLWDTFFAIDRFYHESKFSYFLISNKKNIIYREMLDNTDINEIEFEEDSLHWRLLSECNKKICSIEILETTLNAGKDMLIETISSLKSEGLLYTDSMCSEVLTIINTDNVN